MGFLDRLRGAPRRQLDDDPRKALYVHLADDGAIFVVRGGSGEQLWTDSASLRQ